MKRRSSERRHGPNPRQFKTWVRKMAAYVRFCFFLDVLACNMVPENWHKCVNKGLTYLLLRFSYWSVHGSIFDLERSPVGVCLANKPTQGKTAYTNLWLFPNSKPRSIIHADLPTWELHHLLQHWLCANKRKRKTTRKKIQRHLCNLIVWAYPPKTVELAWHKVRQYSERKNWQERWRRTATLRQAMIGRALHL